QSGDVRHIKSPNMPQTKTAAFSGCQATHLKKYQKAKFQISLNKNILIYIIGQIAPLCKHKPCAYTQKMV
ncbi:MAG: hypothetical protein RSC58_03790, partial [Ruthenibacterium sp.]